MNKFILLLKKLICEEYPLWAWGLECSVCKMSFGSPELHYNHVRKSRTVRKHLNKITKL